MQDIIKAVEEKKVFFKTLLSEQQSSSKKLQRQATNYGTIRFLFFIISLVTIVYFINERNGIIAFAVIFIAPFIFGWLVSKHNKFKRLLKLSKNKISLLEDEIKRLQLDLSQLDGGEEFTDHMHPYTTDMDVFGKHSLFALINRSSLSFGRETLAKWFMKKASIATIEERQKAVSELSQDPDFLIRWWAENRMEEQKKDSQQETVFKWFESNKNMTLPIFWKVIPILALLQFWTIIVLTTIGIIPSAFVGASLFINLLLLLPIQQKVIETQSLTGELSNSLNQHLNLFKLATERKFEEESLTKLSNLLKEPSAPEKIKELNKLMNWLHSRNGMMYWLVDPFFMTDYWVLINCISWKNGYGKFIRIWFETIGKMEALLSLASFSFAHPTYTKSNFRTDIAILSGKEIGHPLIKHEERIHNDFEMSKAGSISLITGANMSGKSTFERSLGVNIILAQMGSVCCVGEFTLSPLQLFTSMRTQDNLSENTSSFYAELKRLKQLVELTKTDQDSPIFYLLDEILKGTNSEDRNKGAESLIRQLMKTNSLGLISTHDLSLASLTNQLDLFANYSFNSEVKGEEILFDYKLHDGPCHTFNAVPLMRKMGIEIVN